jgi:hypothetical protein
MFFSHPNLKLAGSTDTVHRARLKQAVRTNITGYVLFYQLILSVLETRTRNEERKGHSAKRRLLSKFYRAE